jgi:hypothetical protein
MRKAVGFAVLWLLATSGGATGLEPTSGAATAADRLEIAPDGSQTREMPLIPEPTTATLLTLGLLGLALAGRKRTRAGAQAPSAGRPAAGASDQAPVSISLPDSSRIAMASAGHRRAISSRRASGRSPAPGAASASPSSSKLNASGAAPRQLPEL